MLRCKVPELKFFVHISHNIQGRGGSGSRDLEPGDQEPHLVGINRPSISGQLNGVNGAYDAVVVWLKGESAFTSLNFPYSWPPIPTNSSTPMSPRDI